MPAKNPRLTITLEPSIAAQLRRLSELTGNSQSALIADLLVGTGGMFDRLITVLEAANDAKASLRGQLANELHLAQDQIEKQLGLALEDTFFHEARALLDEGERVARRGRRKSSPASAGVASAARSTPMSNRGVRSGRKTSNPPVKKGKK